MHADVVVPAFMVEAKLGEHGWPWRQQVRVQKARQALVEALQGFLDYKAVQQPHVSGKRWSRPGAVSRLYPSLRHQSRYLWRYCRSFSQSMWGVAGVRKRQVALCGVNRLAFDVH
jgi:hypothetical protein